MAAATEKVAQIRGVRTTGSRALRVNKAPIDQNKAPKHSKPDLTGVQKNGRSDQHQGEADRSAEELIQGVNSRRVLVRRESTRGKRPAVKSRFLNRVAFRGYSGIIGP
jgi:hypothetical protein